MSRKVQITITEGQYARLVAEAVRTGRSQSEIARRGLERVLPGGRQRKIFGIEVAIFVRGLPRALRRIHPRLSD
jgi:hypothetical protein